MKLSIPSLKAGHTRRSIALGIAFLVIAVLIVALLPRGTAGLKSTFALVSQRGGVTIAAPDLVVPTSLSLYILGASVAC